MNDIDLPATKRAVTGYLVADVVLAMVIFWAGTWAVFGDPPTWLLRLAAFWLLGLFFNRVMRYLIASTVALRAMHDLDRARREVLK